MKFDYGSDLHISFDKDIDKLIDRFPNNRSETLILAGDIIEVSVLKSKGNSIKTNAVKFLNWVSDNYKTTYYVFGNHEYYDAEINFAIRNFRDILKKMNIDNIIILENDIVEHQDTIILGSTMWTSCKNQDPMVMFAVQDGMNDYRCIDYVDPVYKEKRLLTIHDTVLLNTKFRNKLTQFLELKTDKKKIVVTHHAPSILSIETYYRPGLMSYGYYDDLFDHIFDSDVKIWIHGHSHDSCDYMINESRVVANPRGYIGHETLANDWLINAIEV
jgi:predicted phosphodiesterase